MNPEGKDAPVVMRDESLPHRDYALEATAPPSSDGVTHLMPSSDQSQGVIESKMVEADNVLSLEKQTLSSRVTKNSDGGTENAGKDSEEVKVIKGVTETISTKNLYFIPRHRSRCVACGCPRACCRKNFVFLWIVLFLLLQGGLVAVLIVDLMCIKSEGATIHRYIAEWNMEPAVCRVRGYFIKDFRSCDCLKSEKFCNALIKDYGCIEVMVNVYKYNQTGPIATDTFIWKSDREYVLDTVKPKCFNLDICTINKNKPWHEYRNATKLDERILQEKEKSGEGFVCYYKESSDDDDPIVILEMNTSFWKVLLWFFLPLAGLLFCWLVIFICICWYCCPKEKRKVKGQGESGKHSEPEGGESKYLMPYSD